MIEHTQRLWAAVLHTCFVDACKQRESEDRQSARQFLLLHTKDRHYVAGLAGLDADYLDRAIRVLRNNGWKLPTSTIRRIR
ncbi:hypothetical protein DS909_08890 [Phaeobacter gallaeciensis]|uniref:Uncharacterized protein n=1 Tax=Phaeobacter gallaeciensis TaxID=60890 RepID=A0A366X592_9RHOB|nr:hypothetical protein [Phaeobacter gallaeciensis]RBW56810.1 hypothetical protein DS909_08890 [Phaeobacter gallaeciensis]